MAGLVVGVGYCWICGLDISKGEEMEDERERNGCWLYIFIYSGLVIEWDEGDDLVAGDVVTLVSTNEWSW